MFLSLCASDLKSVIHKFLLPKSSLSWEIFFPHLPRLHIFSSPCLLHRLPRPPRALILSRGVFSSVFSFFFGSFCLCIIISFVTSLVLLLFASFGFLPLSLCSTIVLLMCEPCEWACDFVFVSVRSCCSCCKCWTRCLILQTQKDYRDYETGQHKITAFWQSHCLRKPADCLCLARLFVWRNKGLSPCIGWQCVCLWLKKLSFKCFCDSSKIDSGCKILFQEQQNYYVQKEKSVSLQHCCCFRTYRTLKKVN